MTTQPVLERSLLSLFRSMASNSPPRPLVPLNFSLPILPQLFPGKTPLDAPPLIGLDFDGTLASIVDRPSEARLHPDARSSLIRLKRTAPVVVLSGRSLPDLRLKCREVEGIRLIGNHGLECEGSPEELREVERIVSAWKGSLLEAWSDGRGPGAPAGLFFEDKRLSLTLHFRNVRHVRSALEWMRMQVGRLSPSPRVLLGKGVWNLLPPGTFDKGRAFLELIRRQRAKRSLFIGDDLTDEDVFRLKEPGLSTILVAEGPPPWSTSARFAVPDVPAVALLLETLATELRLRPP